ncbi:hypothetical protein SteCoe_5925 [Stentor coeruleus]|uniref:Uncharacterized protein n=1 Tax=Stentor coeruleus TaxID=5963 RepID=A0A1R2CRC0_9CILI|nr:hypothetical protein SteCoe_5925 [Stentor coeruleus]
MDAKANKFKKLFSKSHEKILKVIMQKYKPTLKHKQQKNPEETKDSGSSYLSSSDDECPIIHRKDYSSQKIKVDDQTLEKQRRQEEATKIMGSNYPNLALSYANGEITLAQLKQSYYSQAKKIDYTCYDNMKNILRIKDQDYTHKSFRQCFRKKDIKKQMINSRPHSVLWNSNTKVQKDCDLIRITSSVYNSEEQKLSNSSLSKAWNNSVKADPGLITDDYRRINVTNDKRERPRSSLYHGGRLSAKAMHDIMVESLFPEKKIVQDKRNISETSRNAMKKAVERVKNYRNNSHSMSISVIGKFKRLRPSVAEVRDIIHLL